MRPKGPRGSLRRRAVTALTTLTVAVSGLAFVPVTAAPAVAADTGSAPAQVLNQPTYSNRLVTIDGRATLVSQTQSGTIAQGYGFNSATGSASNGALPPEEVTEQWVSTGRYEGSGNLAGMQSATVQLFSMSPLELRTMVVYLDTTRSASTDYLIVKKGLADGLSAQWSSYATGTKGGHILASSGLNVVSGDLMVARRVNDFPDVDDVMDHYTISAAGAIAKVNTMCWSNDDCTNEDGSLKDHHRIRILDIHGANPTWDSPYRSEEKSENGDAFKFRVLSANWQGRYDANDPDRSTDLRVFNFKQNGDKLSANTQEFDGKILGTERSFMQPGDEGRITATVDPNQSDGGGAIIEDVADVNPDLYLVSLYDSLSNNSGVYGCFDDDPCAPITSGRDGSENPYSASTPFCTITNAAGAPSISMQATFYGCAVLTTSGTVKTQVIRQLWRDGRRQRVYPERTLSVPGESSLGQPEVRMVVPCLVLPRRASMPGGYAAAGATDCEPNNKDGQPLKEGFVAMDAAYPALTTVVSGRNGVYFTSSSEITKTAGKRTKASAGGDLPNARPDEIAVQNTLDTSTPAYWYSTLHSYASSQSSPPDVEVTELPRLTNRVTARRTTPISDAASNIVPLGLMAAPPTVAGAGQEQDHPEFGKSTGTGTAVSKTLGSHLGAGFGINIEASAPILGIKMWETEIMATVERELENTSTTAKDISNEEAFGGLTTDDVVIYNVQRNQQYTALIEASTLGLGVGTEMNVVTPKGGITSSSSLTSLASRYPDQFGEGKATRAAIDAMLSHNRGGVQNRQKVGDPGSYIPSVDMANGSQIRSYCDTDAQRNARWKSNWLNNSNPFVGNKKSLPPGPDVIFSEPHEVKTGTANQEGAVFEIQESETASRLENTTLDFSVKQQVGIVVAQVNGGVSFGSENSATLSQGTSYEAYVGNIPSSNPALDSEEYDWRAFMCQKTVDVDPGPDYSPYTLWVMNYAVDNYEGSGGMADLSEVVAEGPVGSEEVGPRDVELAWSQASGTVETYDYEIEAIGTRDRRAGEALRFETPSVANDERQVRNTFTLPDDLLPSQIYRWRVKSTDFFGNSVRSDWEYFVTAENPVARLTADRSVVMPGAEVTFTSASSGAHLTETWDFGDGTPLVTNPGETVRHSYAAPGTYEVTLTVSNVHGTSSATHVVVVTASEPDSYTVGENGTLEVNGADGLLANDDPAATEVTLVEGPRHGDLALAPDGSFTYVPTAGYCGTDAFTYTNDVLGEDLVLAAEITVTCINDVPVVKGEAFDLAPGQTLTLPAPGLLANDADLEGPIVLDTTPVVAPQRGRLALNRDGSFSYTPTRCGTDTITYRVLDEDGASATAELVFEISCAGRILPDDVTAVEDSVADVNVLDNDTAPFGRGLQLASVQQPSNGTLAFEANGRVRYTPNAHWCGTEVLAYEAADDEGKVYAGSITFRIGCVNDAPVTARDTFTLRQGKVKTIWPLRNDSDVDGDTLRITNVIGLKPAHLKRIKRQGVTQGLRIKLPKSKCGRVRIAYVANDGNRGTTIGRIVLKVTCARR